MDFFVFILREGTAYSLDVFNSTKQKKSLLNVEHTTLLHTHLNMQHNYNPVSRPHEPVQLFGQRCVTAVFHTRASKHIKACGPIGSLYDLSKRFACPV